LHNNKVTELIQIEQTLQTRNTRFETLDKYNISNHEFKVLYLKAAGCCNKEVATICEVEVKTIENHITNITKKINSNSTKEIVNFAFRFGLVKVAKMYLEGFNELNFS
jgi:DNA-binding NarL/FixJ family response regulator